MILNILQSHNGDCLLLKGSDGKNLMIDGGMKSSYEQYVRPILGEMRRKREKLDLVCVSHIDDDHIGGILQLLDDEVKWRVHEHRRNSGRRSKEPDFPRPPEISEIWHNAFHEQIRKNRGRVKNMLAAAAGFLWSAGDPQSPDLARHYMNLITGEKKAIQLSRRIDTRHLGTPLNESFDNKLALMRDERKIINFGSMKIYLIGPFESDLIELRERWNIWLEGHENTLRRIKKNAREDERDLRYNLWSDVDSSLGNNLDLADGSRSTSTANLASLMFLVEENGKSILFTGDGHANDILKGLDHQGKLNVDGGIHVNVLKVPHHGSSHNVDDEFARRVTADHYVFCGNGTNSNPDLKTVMDFIHSRIGAPEQLSKNSSVEKKFKLWFNSSSSFSGASRNQKEHLKKLEECLKVHSQNSNEKLEFEFFDEDRKEINLESVDLV